MYAYELIVGCPQKMRCLGCWARLLVLILSNGMKTITMYVRSFIDLCNVVLGEPHSATKSQISLKDGANWCTIKKVCREAKQGV